MQERTVPGIHINNIIFPQYFFYLTQCQPAEVIQDVYVTIHLNKHVSVSFPQKSAPLFSLKLINNKTGFFCRENIQDTEEGGHREPG